MALANSFPEAAHSASLSLLERPAAGVPGRKKASAPVLPSGDWKSGKQSRGTSPPEEFAGSLYAMVAPQPGHQRDRLTLAHDVLLDFAAILCGTTIASIVLKPLLPILSGMSIFRFTAVQGSFFTLIAYSEGLYRKAASCREKTRIACKCCFLASLLGMASPTPVSSAPMLAMFCASIFLLGRRRWRRHGSHTRIPRLNSKNTLIVGSGSIAEKLAQHFRSHHDENRVVVGFVDDHAPVGKGVVGRIHDIPVIAKTRFVDEIIVAGVNESDALRAIAFARSCALGIQIIPDMFGFNSYGAIFHQIGNVPAIALQEEGPPRLEELFKRVLDVGIAIIALTLSAPLFGLIAAAIRLDSAGPVFYAAERVGFKGCRFRCYKFRTMIVDADQQKEDLREKNERSGASFKIERDPRVTPIGRWLRRYSLDELPQLWNVIKGEMSLVGPRPHPPDDFARYDIDDLKRLEAIPGLTGLWQVSARKNPSFKLNVQLDREYIEHWSLKADFKILMKTVSAVLQGTGS